MVKTKNKLCIKVNIRELNRVLSTKYQYIINMLYNIIVLESSMSFYIIHDYVTMTVCTVTLTSNSKSKNNKINEKENWNMKWNENK